MLSDHERIVLRILFDFSILHKRMPDLNELETISELSWDHLHKALNGLREKKDVFKEISC